jgi:ABC-type phosphate/phosphonate transport system substrate-binding protein
VAGVRDFGMELLAAPQVDGEILYHSLLLVPAGSEAQGMADLRGGEFAFTDPMSTTGRNYPIVLVQDLGEIPIGPLVRPQHRAELLDILLSMSEDPAGRIALDATGMDRFVLTEDSACNTVRDLENRVVPETSP